MQRKFSDWPFRAGPGGRDVPGARWRRDTGLRTLPVRWSRQRERWEVEWEALTSVSVLEDLAAASSDAESGRIITRYVVLRFVLLAFANPADAASFATEQATATAYLPLVGPAGEPEREALGVALKLAVNPPAEPLCEALCQAGAEASKALHFGGAFALYRTAYQLGLEASRPDAARRAAASIAEIAKLTGATRSARLWARRAKVLARRAAARLAPR